MSDNGLSDFLHRGDTTAGLFLDHLAGFLVDVSSALKHMRAEPGIDFDQLHDTSNEMKQVSLDELERRHDRLQDAIAEATSHAAASPLTDADVRKLFVDLHHHAMDLCEVFDYFDTPNGHSSMSEATRAAESLELCATALIGLGEAYAAGQRSVEESTDRARSARRSSKSGRERGR